MSFGSVETPLLEAMYASDAEAKMHARHVRELAEIYSVPIEIRKPRLERQNAEAIDNEIYGRMALAWNKRKGPGTKRKTSVRSTKPRRKAKRKVTKKKWVPRKTYLARLRKKKKRK